VPEVLVDHEWALGPGCTIKDARKTSRQLSDIEEDFPPKFPTSCLPTIQELGVGTLGASPILRLSSQAQLRSARTSGGRHILCRAFYHVVSLIGTGSKEYINPHGFPHSLGGAAQIDRPRN
jgi:hypothetical protein